MTLRYDFGSRRLSLPSFLPLSSPLLAVLLFHAGSSLFLRVPQPAKHFSPNPLSWIGNKTMRSGGKTATKIQNNVLSCDTKWRICYAYLLLMSVILCTLITCTQYAVCNMLHVFSMLKWSTCGHHYAAITASTHLEKAFHKPLRTWLLKCAPTQRRSCSEVDHWWWVIKPGLRSVFQLGCRMRLMSGLCAGQPSSSTPNQGNHFFLDLALFTEALSCWSK